MKPFSIPELVQIVEGELFGSENPLKRQISNFITDSRTFFNPEQSAFFALTGQRNNGHNYIEALIERGISCFIVSDAKFITRNATFILVKDTTLALQQLAAKHRNKFNYCVIGITGSNGKTIVKEWLHDLLFEEFRIVRNPGSYNSQIGVPLSVLLMEDNFNLGIFEAGISKPGEMINLEPVISPEIGILTNIGDAHQENFISIKQKINEKLKLFKNSKTLIYSVDNEIVKNEIDFFCNQYGVKPVGWTSKENKTHIVFNVKSLNEKTEIQAFVAGNTFLFTIPFTDSSAIENACNCFALLTELQHTKAQVLSKFEKLETVAMRLEIKQGINQCLLINDFYNSDLNSLSIALSVLRQQAVKANILKHLIISDIQQTGIAKNELYEKVRNLAEEWEIDEITGIGKEISQYSEKFRCKKRFYISTEDFIIDFDRNKFHSKAILIKGARQFRFENISGLLQQKAHQTVLEVNMNALVYNLNFYRTLIKPKTKIMAMVKAFSYGSGDVEIARLLQYQNIDYLAVAVADEGVQLRNAGVITPIVVMNPESHSFQNIIDYQLEPNLYSIDLLEKFTHFVSTLALSKFPVHIKIDSGMNRLGLKSTSEISKLVAIIKKDDTLFIKSVFSHLAASDESAFDAFTKSQFDTFETLSALIINSFNYPIDRHILNSAGVERFPEKQYEMIRLGIGLYGISATGLPLKNIGTLKSTVSQIKTLQPFETTGYSRKGVFERESVIAIVPLGYADGLDRKLGNRKGFAFSKGFKVPITGNICMDMLMLDISGTDIQPGDEVIFIGDEILITEVALQAGTIPYEILTGISQRVKRIYIYE